MKHNAREKSSSTGGIFVVIPCFGVSKQILDTLNRIGPEVTRIIVIDDACPEKSGDLVTRHCKDKRVEVITHKVNLGVGGAVKTGYQRAIELNAEIVVKLDGDGQMNPSQINDLIAPISDGVADYTKGNRFYSIEGVTQMPYVRLFGNLILSFMNKFSTGYWKIFDPTNGFTAIKTGMLKKLPLNKIDNRYFFESDILFRLGLINARVRDVPINAIYKDEKSNLKVSRAAFEFPFKHFRNFNKRVIYSYYLRDLNLASIELPLGLLCACSGTYIGFSNFVSSSPDGAPTPTGTLTLFSVLVLLGVQLILSFFNYDIAVREN